MTSGAIQRYVPVSAVMTPLVTTRATPKSAIFTVPCSSMRRLAAFRSRCTMRIWCK